MSNNSENKIWEEITSTLEVDHFHDWFQIENLFGEFGEPGFTQIDKVLNQPNKSLNVTFTLYRNENGKLVGINGFYIDNNIQKPFTFMVHPDYLRTGIGTKIADFITKQFAEKNNREFDYEQSWRDVSTTESAVKFANKYAKQQYDKINNLKNEG